MSAYTQEPAPPPPPPIYAAPGRKVEVNLTDTVHWGWYVAAVLFPIVGAIAGIVFMAKSKIGPAIALWATCFLAFMAWGTIYAAMEYDRLFGDDTSAILEEFNTSSETGAETDTVNAYAECVDQAETYDEMAEC